MILDRLGKGNIAAGIKRNRRRKEQKKAAFAAGRDKLEYRNGTGFRDHCINIYNNHADLTTSNSTVAGHPDRHPEFTRHTIQLGQMFVHPFDSNWGPNKSITIC